MTNTTTKKAAITLAKIDSAIGTFSTNRATLQALGASIAMMIVYHCAPKEVSDDCQGSGDCTRMLKLASEMPKTWQVQLLNWCTAYTPIRFNVNNGKVGFDPKYKALSREEKLAIWKVAEAAENPFFDFKEPEAVRSDLSFEDLLKMTEQMAKRIEKKIKDGEVPADLIPTAKRHAERLAAMKVTKVAPEKANDNSTPSSKEQGATAKKAANG